MRVIVLGVSCAEAFRVAEQEASIYAWTTISTLKPMIWNLERDCSLSNMDALLAACPHGAILYLGDLIITRKEN